MIVIDTLRADALGCYGAEGILEPDGSRRSPTPNLDALGERGIRFASVESSSSWTVTSAVSYLSGMTPMEHGVNSKLISAIPDDVPLLPMALDEAGFETAAFVCNPMLGPKLGFDRGFDTFDRDKFAPAAPAVNKALAWAKERVAASPDRRLFLYVHLFDPHWPYDPAPEEAARFALPESPLSPEQQVTASMGALTGNVEAAQQLLDWVPWCLDAYSACVTTADRETGRLLKGLEALGILDDALVVATSDHGEEFGEHGAIGHAKQLYAESLRVPLLIAGPGIPSGRLATEPSELRNLAATVSSHLELNGECRVRGLDLLDPAARARGASQDHVAAVQQGILPREEGGFRRVLQMMSLRRGRERAIVGFETRFEGGEAWIETLDESGYSLGRRRADLTGAEGPILPLLAELQERAESARLGAELGASDLDERKTQLRELGYFGASEDDETDDEQR
ncbi:Choline-sulfatase [Planctomycetes bacterium Poly30]|uniref:Choline-sulfatase n=2 Tax=Saltatorellus ferox TaxID=2528018 RepID=A0A518F0R8_9BACT|nr:Choline-sulfatase [Planctomycetes bacterium Poly30]